MAIVTIDTSGAFGAEISIDGLDVVLNNLADVAPDVRRKLLSELRKAVGMVAQTAAREVDSRTGETAAGFKVTRRGSAMKIVNKTRGAAILEFAATPRCPQGQNLVNTLEEKYGSPGRILWGAWDVLAPAVEDRVRRVVTDAELKLEEALS